MECQVYFHHILAMAYHAARPITPSMTLPTIVAGIRSAPFLRELGLLAAKGAGEILSFADLTVRPLGPLDYNATLRLNCQHCECVKAN